MGNPIFNAMNNKSNNNSQNMFTAFSQFKQMLGAKNPDELINQLVSSGKVSKEQLELAKQLANQFSGLLK